MKLLLCCFLRINVARYYKDNKICQTEELGRLIKRILGLNKVKEQWLVPNLRGSIPRFFPLIVGVVHESWTFILCQWITHVLVVTFQGCRRTIRVRWECYQCIALAHVYCGKLKIKILFLSTETYTYFSHNLYFLHQFDTIFCHISKLVEITNEVSYFHRHGRNGLIFFIL